MAKAKRVATTSPDIELTLTWREALAFLKLLGSATDRKVFGAYNVLVEVIENEADEYDHTAS